MPRLSVDIDLAYLPVSPRAESSADIGNLVNGMMANIERVYPQIVCRPQFMADGFPSKIQVIKGGVEIKVEINNVFRGAIYEPVMIKLCDSAQELFEKYAKVHSVSFEDLYAGKFCAALDRQHPRDLFDVIKFFSRHQFTAKLKDAFLVYLIAAGRPVIELLQPNFLDQEELYTKEFSGMTNQRVSYAELEEARERLVETISASLSDSDKEFLISFESAEPNWSLLAVRNVSNLPAIKWRLANLHKMATDKRLLHVRKLEKSFITQHVH